MGALVNRCTGRDIDAFLLVDLFDVGISGHTGISCDNLFERVLRAMAGYPVACPESDEEFVHLERNSQSNPSLHCLLCCLCHQKCHWESR